MPAQPLPHSMTLGALPKYFKPQFLHLKNEAVTFAFSARQDCGDIPMGCTGTLPENKDYWDSIWTHRIPLVIPATL